MFPLLVFCALGIMSLSFGLLGNLEAALYFSLCVVTFGIFAQDRPLSPSRSILRWISIVYLIFRLMFYEIWMMFAESSFASASAEMRVLTVLIGGSGAFVAALQFSRGLASFASRGPSVTEAPSTPRWQLITEAAWWKFFGILIVLAEAVVGVINNFSLLSIGLVSTALLAGIIGILSAQEKGTVTPSNNPRVDNLFLLVAICSGVGMADFVVGLAVGLLNLQLKVWFETPRA